MVFMLISEFTVSSSWWCLCWFQSLLWVVVDGVCVDFRVYCELWLMVCVPISEFTVSSGWCLCWFQSLLWAVFGVCVDFRVYCELCLVCVLISEFTMNSGWWRLCRFQSLLWVVVGVCVDFRVYYELWLIFCIGFRVYYELWLVVFVLISEFTDRRAGGQCSCPGPGKQDWQSGGSQWRGDQALVWSAKPHHRKGMWRTRVQHALNITSPQERYMNHRSPAYIKHNLTTGKVCEGQERKGHFFFFFFFFCVSQLYLWGSLLLGEIFVTIKVVTFRLRGWCVLGVFLLPAFTRLGHERQDLLSPCDEMHVCTD